MKQAGHVGGSALSIVAGFESKDLFVVLAASFLAVFEIVRQSCRAGAQHDFALEVETEGKFVFEHAQQVFGAIQFGVENREVVPDGLAIGCDFAGRLEMFDTGFAFTKAISRQEREFFVKR